MNKSKYDFYAYIVFADKDKNWGKWLQRKLRSYRLPQSGGEKKTNESSRYFPVLHRKETLLEGREGVKSAIERSKYLIVVCSPNALTDSETIDEVIRRFLKGGADPSSIIPFITDNDKKPEVNCFPRELQSLCEQKTILGANIFDSGRHNAFLKVVAHMHGLKLEQLESEDSRRKKKTQKKIAVAIGILVLILGFIGYRAWDYYVPKTEYYANYKEEYGIPVGIGELSGRDLNSSDAHYAIISSKRMVRELRFENADGSLGAYPEETCLERPSRITYGYSDNGELSEADWYDDNENELMRLVYINRKTIDVYPNENGRAHSDGAYLKTIASNVDSGNTTDTSEEDNEIKGIIRYLVDYDENGYMSELRYSSSEVYNTATTDENGIGGFRFEHDDLGRLTRVTYIVVKDLHSSAIYPEYYEPVSDPNSVCCEKCEYDDSYRLRKVTWYDPVGNEIKSREGF
ncbi:MAG: toll/interleukin-1 receptor domain-containing protein [Lachnospiraceae bacterium]|nr:toll/interleukin-1 receptor domain-containing protein [Lachnospiraceae bacterium]